MNMRYHAAREAVLDGRHRWLMFGVIALGAGSVIDLEATGAFAEQFKLIAGALVAVLGALDLTFDLSNRARAHSLMRRRYCEILAGAERQPDALHGVDGALTDIAGEEEPVFRALLMLCSNEVESAVYGDDEAHVVVGFWHRLFANVFRFDGTDFEDKHPKIQPTAG